MVVGKFHVWGIISEAQKMKLENCDAHGFVVRLYTKTREWISNFMVFISRRVENILQL
jgi:hypothetical protein